MREFTLFTLTQIRESQRSEYPDILQIWGFFEKNFKQQFLGNHGSRSSVVQEHDSGEGVVPERPWRLCVIQKGDSTVNNMVVPSFYDTHLLMYIGAGFSMDDSQVFKDGVEGQKFPSVVCLKLLYFKTKLIFYHLLKFDENISHRGLRQN